MEDKEHSYQDAPFQGDLDALKDSVARIANLLEKTLRNASGEDPSTKPVSAAQTQVVNYPEKIIGERV